MTTISTFYRLSDEWLADQLGFIDTLQPISSSNAPDWTANMASVEDAAYFVSYSDHWQFSLPSDASSDLVCQLVDHIAWNAYLANTGMPEASQRAKKFWSQCRRVIAGLPVPATVVGDGYLELSWHQGDRYLDLEVGSTGHAECFVAFGDGAPTKMQVDLDSPSKKFREALATFGASRSA